MTDERRDENKRLLLEERKSARRAFFEEIKYRDLGGGRKKSDERDGGKIINKATSGNRIGWLQGRCSATSSSVSRMCSDYVVYFFLSFSLSLSLSFSSSSRIRNKNQRKRREKKSIDERRERTQVASWFAVAEFINSIYSREGRDGTEAGGRIPQVDMI